MGSAPLEGTAVHGIIREQCYCRFNKQKRLGGNVRAGGWHPARTRRGAHESENMCTCGWYRRKGARASTIVMNIVVQAIPSIGGDAGAYSLLRGTNTVRTT
jgi:hypothetical protein